jgi:hypothetical protein
MDTERRAHILQVGADNGLDRLTHPRGRALFNGQGEVGRTPHVVVYSDGSPQGDATAQAVLASAEDDYAATAAWFGGIDLPAGQEGDDQSVPRTATPVQVLLDPQAGGAYHFGCDATDIYLEPTPELASGFFVAELVEVFEAALNNGWDCGQTNGEGLSRVLAGERNPNLGGLFVQTEQAWWADGRADYTSDNSADDTNADANGCATLYLYYLHAQLGYDWAAIVAAGAPTLAQTYTKLSGRDGASGFADFLSRLATLDAGDGTLNVPASGNPFPISETAPVPASAPVSPAQPEPAPASPASPEPTSPEPASPVPAGAGAGSVAEPVPAVAALDRTGPIRSLDATERQGGGSGMLVGVGVVVAVLLVLLVVLLVSGTIRL